MIMDKTQISARLADENYTGVPDEKDYLQTIRYLQTCLEEIQRELAIAMRACGNWREFANTPNVEEPKDWRYALRCTAELRELKTQLKNKSDEWEKRSDDGLPLNIFDSGMMAAYGHCAAELRELSI